MATRGEVVDFLNLFKGCMTLELWHVRDREKNRQGLIDLDISPAERRDILMQLEPDDYSDGPKPDDTDDTKEVWEFGRSVEGVEVYIKLRVAQDPRRKTVCRALVWSFHPAEHALRYPFKGGRA